MNTLKKSLPKIAIYGHSQLKEFERFPPADVKEFQLKFFSVPGAKIDNLTDKTKLD